MWTKEELEKIGDAEELDIQSFRRDGTLRKPVTIWVVRVGDDLYVRSGYGLKAAWFRGTQLRREGHIRAGGIDRDVLFEAPDPAVHDRIDTAYRQKYRRHEAQYLAPMVAPETRSVTIRLVPRPPAA